MGPSGTCYEAWDHPRDRDDKHWASMDKSALASKTPETRVRAGPLSGSFLKPRCPTRSVMAVGWGQEGGLSPTQGDARERDTKIGGPQDPTLKLEGAR